MTRRLALSLICCVVPLLAQAATIYRWVDDQGHAHFGDTVPAQYRSVARTVDSSGADLPDSARDEAVARAARERARQADFDAAQRARAHAAEPAAPALPDSSRSQADAGGESECDRLWRIFMESEECFAPYRLPSGGIKVEAYAACKEVKRPSVECGPSKKYDDSTRGYGHD